MTPSSIHTIEHRPVEGNYDASVELSNGLKTSFNKDVEFINGLSGEAEIILNDERLITRLFKKLAN